MGYLRKNISGGSGDLVKRAVTAAKDVKPSGKAPPTKSNKKRSYSFSKGKAASEKGTPEKAAPEKAAPKPAKRRRSSFGRGASQPPTPAPQRRARNPELQRASAGMDAARARQQARPGGAPGGPSTTRRGAVDMNRSSARGTGMPRTPRAGVGAPSFRTQSPGTPLSPIVPTSAPTPPPSSTGTNPSAASNSRFPSAPGPFGGRHVNQDGRYRGPVPFKEGGGVKKGGKAKATPSRGNGIAQRGKTKGRMA
jgi:translation initiation factor IF-2